jgi:hypothetical protein
MEFVTGTLTYEDDLLDLRPDLGGVAAEQGVGAAAPTPEHPIECWHGTGSSRAGDNTGQNRGK